MTRLPIPVDVCDLGIVATILAMVVEGETIDQTSRQALMETIKRLSDLLDKAGV